MVDKRHLLIEIGTEELPPKSLLTLSEAFADNLRELLSQRALTFSGLESFATPRRLGVLVHDLDAREPDQEQFRRGPSAQAGFDAEGNPTKAALGFAASCGIAVESLLTEESPKGSWLVARQHRPGQLIIHIVPSLVEQALAALPIPRRMRWGEGEAEFVRPVHWVVLLFGMEAISGRVLGVTAGRDTRGHRFHHPKPIHLASASDYAETLRGRGSVEPSFGERRAEIARQVERLASLEGGRVHLDPDLLDEVTALCEWPVALLGRFDEAFLRIPSEVLIETMQSHQKYFPMIDASGELLPRFITISNIHSRDPEQVRGGNERVIRPRFADAAFFWKQDLKRSLDVLALGLGAVVFQERLGSLADKSERVGLLARRIAEHIGLDPEVAARAAHLAKADLLSSMIAEFPSLQGIMGQYYAERAGENPSVSAAIREQYLPRKAGDALPHTPCGQALALADRLDTLVGIFAIGQRPTGVKDPYALRRAALGALRILIETPLPLNLEELLKLAAEGLEQKIAAQHAATEVLEYALERLSGYYQERGISADVVEAVVARYRAVPSDIDARVRAVHGFRSLPQAVGLAAANKRIRNILRRNTEAVPEHPVLHLLTEPSERQLAERLEAMRSAIAPLLRNGDYGGALTALAGLKPTVDAFFEEVMVMAEDSDLRRNRLALLRSLEELFLQVADISLLQ